MGAKGMSWRRQAAGVWPVTAPTSLEAGTPPSRPRDAGRTARVPHPINAALELNEALRPAFHRGQAHGKRLQGGREDLVQMKNAVGDLLEGHSEDFTRERWM